MALNGRRRRRTDAPVPAGRPQMTRGGVAATVMLLAAACSLPAAAAEMPVAGNGSAHRISIGGNGRIIVAQATPSPPPESARAFRWRDFDSRAGRFQAAFPGRPEVTRRKIRTEVGEIASVRHTAGDGAQATYDVTYNDYPRGSIARLTPRKLLDAARDGLVYQSKGKLVSEQPITLGKVAGRDHEIVGADGMRYRVRLLVVKDRIYQITAMAQPPARPDEKRFFDSFRLTGGR